MYIEMPPLLKIGHSVDYHNIIPIQTYKQKLGGIEFEVNFKIVAHSDGDIIIHSVCEAIMGALGIGDLGQWFSDSSEKTKNMNSLEILQFCVDKCKELNYNIINIDISIVSDTIFFMNKKEKIKEFLSNFLKTNINVKATRFEQNNTSKIKCYSVCMLMNKYVF